MRIFLRCTVVTAAVFLALYPLALHGRSAIAIGCGLAGFLVTVAGLVFGRAWPGGVGAALFAAEYLIVLVAGSIALDAFALIEAILVIVLLESTDLATVRADRIEVAVIRNRFRFLAGALVSGGTIGFIVMSIAPALAVERNPALLVTGAVAALGAGVGVLIAVRRAS
ncbi:MAG: hypothetical protein ACRDKT_15465 [Actinomycetota bacterium]